MANFKRIAQLANFLNSLPEERVQMKDWSLRKTSSGTYIRVSYPPHENDCNTAGCIAGWAVSLFGNATDSPLWLLTAARLLDLTEDEANYLFLGHWSDKPLRAITKAEVVGFLCTVCDRQSIFDTNVAEAKEKLKQYYSTNNPDKSPLEVLAGPGHDLSSAHDALLETGLPGKFLENLEENFYTFAYDMAGEPRPTYAFRKDFLSWLG